MKKKIQNRSIQFRGSELTVKRLSALAKFHELTQSETLRRLIAKEHEEWVARGELREIKS